MRVYKRSGRPFKSGFKINTVTSTITNPNTGKPAYTFVEDDSIVDIRTCREIPVNYISGMTPKEMEEMTATD